MNKKLQQKVRKVRETCGEREIRRLFVKRENDDFFAEIGRAVEPKNKSRVELVWLGFEILINSVYRAGHAAW